MLATQRDVIAVDLPGYGASPRSGPVSPAGPAGLADALEQLLDQLALPTVHLAGNSMGGWVALELAGRGRARSAVLLSPAGFYNTLEAGYLWASLRISVGFARLVAPYAERLLANRLIRTILFGQCVGRPSRLPADAAVSILRAAATGTGFDADLSVIVRQRAPSGPDLAIPITIGWGCRDWLLAPWQAGRAARAIPTARVVRLPGVGHIPVFDDPARIAALLLTGSRSAAQ